MAAVTAMVSEGRSSRTTVRYAVAWGAGHALMLFAVGGALYLLRAEMPHWLEVGFELGVSLMLIALGARALVQAARFGKRQHLEGAHAVEAHPHAPTHAHVHIGRHSFATLPFLVGIVHGLAGSGALAALMIPRAESASLGFLVLTLYSLGTVLGMGLLAGVVGKPLQKVMTSPRWQRGLLVAAGLLSLGVGVAWGASFLA